MVIFYFDCRLRTKSAVKIEKINQKQVKAIEKLKMKL